MNARLLTAGTVALCLTIVVATERTVAWFAGSRAAGTESIAAAAIANGSSSLSVDAAYVQTLQASAMSNATVDDVDTAAVAESPKATDRIASIGPKPAADAAPVESSIPSEQKPVQLASANPFDVLAGEANKAVGTIEIRDECLAVDVCIDRYLWALYERTPKEDTIRVSEQRKVKVKRRGKIVTVKRTFTRLVDEDFTWKDPKAADKAGMTMIDYVIGGMDRGFKLKLFHTLHAAEQAGLSPGITSAFRDDYRQSIASGLKAASDRSYHGGSFRGGYGHGLAADIVSVKGGTRAERWISTEAIWKWIDDNGNAFGIGRPYSDRDPPHLAPIDGKEYADHHRPTKTEAAASDAKKKSKDVQDDRGGGKKRAKTAAASKAKTT